MHALGCDLRCRTRGVKKSGGLPLICRGQAVENVVVYLCVIWCMNSLSGDVTPLTELRLKILVEGVDIESCAGRCLEGRLNGVSLLFCRFEKE